LNPPEPAEQRSGGETPEAIPADSLLARLNPQQVDAVTHGGGPLLVLAGAAGFLFAQQQGGPRKGVGLTLERHPLHLLRHRLDRYRYLQADRLPDHATGRHISVAGLVITKQRPGTASGVTFVTLEDETGHINLIVWKQVAEQYRAALLNARLMGVRGELQIERKVIHVIARQLIDHTEMLGDLEVRSRDFR